MNKYSLSIIAMLFITVFVFGCNEKSVIEGFVPEYKAVIFEKPIMLTSNISNDTIFRLTELSTYAYFRMNIIREKALSPYGTIATGDSVLKIAFNQNILQTSYANGCTAKYSKGDIIDITHMTGSAILSVLNKHMPYASNAYAVCTQYGPQKISFGLNEDGYAGFKYIDPNTGTKTYYGWLLLQCSPNGILIKGYGYKSFETIKAGE